MLRTATLSKQDPGRRRMTLGEAIPLLRQLRGVPIGRLRKQFPDRMVVNKGSFGSTLEIALGLNPFSGSTDFLDGELKSNQTLPTGKPKESIAICAISKLVSGGLFGPVHAGYQDSYLCKKLSNVLIVQVVKEGPEDEWFVLDLYHCVATLGTELHDTFARDYETIWQLVRDGLARDPEGVLHTTNGRFLQIRVKDTRPYRSIHCPHHARLISEKNFAFYLQATFMRAVVAGTFPEVQKIS